MIVAGASLLFAAVTALPPAEEILSHVAEVSARRHAVSYSGTRIYTMRNFRFNRQARLVVRMTYRPGEGKRFTEVERSGSDRLLDIIQKLIDTEAEGSRPGEAQSHGISPVHYRARLRGAETVNGRECWVLELKPRAKNRYLIEGTAWVDKASYNVVRLEGNTAASLSIWVGAPHIAEDRAPVEGIWLPAHTRSRTSTLLTGASEFEIVYTSYQVQR